MTLVDLVNGMEDARTAMEVNPCPATFRTFNAIETRITRLMAERKIPAIRVCDTMFVRYNDSLTVYRNVPEAASIEIPEPEPEGA